MYVSTLVLKAAKKHDSPLTRPIEKKVGSDLHFPFAFFYLLAPPIHLSYVNEGNEMINLLCCDFSPLVGRGGKACREIIVIVICRFLWTLAKFNLTLKIQAPFALFFFSCGPCLLANIFLHCFCFLVILYFDLPLFVPERSISLTLDSPCRSNLSFTIVEWA